MTLKKKIYEIKRARGDFMTSWINRSDEALMDMRKKLATAPGAKSSDSTMIPSTDSRMAAASQSGIARSGHCWSHDHDKRSPDFETCREISP